MDEDSTTARLFIGAAPTDALRQQLADLQQQLAAHTGMAGVRWTHPQDLHLTLRFLGATPAASVATVEAALETVARRLPGSTLAGATVRGWPATAARLLVAEFASSPGIQALAAALERVARELGYAPEQRRFRPHVTLGRSRTPITSLPTIELPAADFAIAHVDLYESLSVPQPPRYRVRHRVALQPPASD